MNEIDLTLLHTNSIDKIELDGKYEIPSEYYKDSDVLKIDPVSVNGSIIRETDDIDYIDVNVDGIMYLQDSISLEEEKYPFSLKIEGNLADFAADDAYASGEETVLTLPDVANMKLAEAYQSAEGWFADYVSNDTRYASKPPFAFENNGRYRTTGNVDHPTGAINGNAYYCVTLGRIPSLVITKILDSDKQPDHSFIFEVEKPDKTIIKVVIPSNAFELVDEKMQASVTITKLITGQYTVQEIADWSWRYQFESAETKKDLSFSTITNGVVFNLSADGEEAIFKNNRTKPSWLSGDSYCENWWGGTAEGKTIEKRNEKNEIIHE